MNFKKIILSGIALTLLTGLAILPVINIYSSETVLAEEKINQIITVTSQTGEAFEVNSASIVHDVQDQLIARYNLFLTQRYATYYSDVRELIDVTVFDDSSIYIYLHDNNGVENFAYHINGEIYYTGHSLGGCTYVTTTEIPLEKYQTGDIVDITDFDPNHSWWGDLTGDQFENSGIVPEGVDLSTEMYVIADFHGNFMKTPYYSYSNNIHLFPGFRVNRETVTPIPPINLHFLINDIEVWNEISLTDWAELKHTLDEDQEVWAHLNAQENINLVSDDPFVDYGQWLLDFEYVPGTFTVSNVYFTMTTTEKNADLTIKHNYDGNVLTAWDTTTTAREAAALFSETIPKYSHDLNAIEVPKELENDYQTVRGWEISTTDEVIADDKYEFTYYFKPKVEVHQVETTVEHIYHNYDDYSIFMTNQFRDDPIDGIKMPEGMTLDYWQIDGEPNQLTETVVNRESYTTKEIRATHYLPVFKKIELNDNVQLTDKTSATASSSSLPETGERIQFSKLIAMGAIIVTYCVFAIKYKLFIKK